LAGTACNLPIDLIRGNHDRNAGDPRFADIEVQDEPCCWRPFALQARTSTHPTHPVLAGHVHPASSLRGKARQRCACLAS
jgi:metallophosphoesterase superfamily enzyme